MNNILLPIYKKFNDMIIAGDKQYEFRNRIGKWKEGDVIYFYECKGKKVKCPECKGDWIIDWLHPTCGYYEEECSFCRYGYSNEGSGRVLATAEIAEIYFALNKKDGKVSIGMGSYIFLRNDDHEDVWFDKLYFNEMGYTNQTYAINLDNIKQVDYSLAELGVKRAPQGFVYLDNVICDKLKKEKSDGK